jgi:hypothetical protein
MGVAAPSEFFDPPIHQHYGTFSTLVGCHHSTTSSAASTVGRATKVASGCPWFTNYRCSDSSHGVCMP